MKDNRVLDKLKRMRYPLLVLMLGVLLMLLPTGKPSPESGGEEDQLQGLLSSTEGVGEAQVLISEKGVVVVCAGAENAKVRLDILRAVGSYTGFGSDKITILKLADQ